MLFMHIPLIEYQNLFNDYEFYGHAQEPSHCQGGDTGMFMALKEQPCVNWVSCGHDHSNDHFGNYQGITLGYGRKTGFGCYGPASPLVQGARVFEFTMEPWGIETWVREQSGVVRKETVASYRRSTTYPQYECGHPHAHAAIYDESEELAYIKDHYLARPDLRHLVPDEFLD
jgi:hypothetical protein